MMVRPCHLLEVGNRQSPEFQPLVRWLDEQPGLRSRQQVRRLTEGTPLAHLSEYPDLVVVWQNYSDEYSPEEIQTLLSSLPLARIVCVSGAWCAADGRSRSLWPPRFRVTIEQAQHRLQLEWQSLTGSTIPACPWTAAVDEIWRWSQEYATPVDLSGLRFVLQIPDRFLREAVQSELLSANAIHSEDAAASAHVVVIDVEPWTALLRERVLKVREQSPSAVLLGLSGWVTHDLLANWKACGIQGWLSKTAPETWPQRLLEATAS